MYMLEVGKLYVTGKTRWEERAEYNFRDGQHELRIFLANINPMEIHDIRLGEAEFAVFVEKDILLFLYHFGNSIPWSDSPYSIHLVGKDERTIPKPSKPIERDLLTVILVEATTGIIKALRQLTIGVDVTRVLREEIRKQSERPWPGDLEYDRQLNNIYRRYSQTDDFLPYVLARDKGGT